MPVYIDDLCDHRPPQQRQREELLRNDLREKHEAIKRAADPLIGEDVERPFMIPRSHDPFDVWFEILHFTTNPKDILMLWEVSPFFREILSCSTKYIQARLPQIVQIIMDKRPAFLQDGDDDGSSDDEDEEEHFRKTLLNFRMISKLCRSSTEALLHTADSDSKKKKFYLTLSTCEQVQDIIDDIREKEVAVDSFFPPNVKVDENQVWDSDEEMTAFSESVGVFLGLIGKRVKTLFYDSIEPPQGVHEQLSEWVMCMPNLEYLETDTWIPDEEPVTIPSFEEIPAFPHCPNLRSFIQKREMMPKPYLQRILEANPQIKVLSMPKDGDAEEYPDPSGMNWQLLELECLHTPLYTSLVNYLEFQLPLKEIVLHGSKFYWEISSERLFTFLHQFKDSLEHLELLDINLDEGNGHLLELPHLKFFKWVCKSTFNDLRFLMHAERLEEIHVEMKASEDVIYAESFSDTVLMMLTDGFNGLSVWDVFHRVKMFRIALSYDICRPRSHNRSTRGMHVGGRRPCLFGFGLRGRRRGLGCFR